MLFLDREQQIFEQQAEHSSCAHCGHDKPSRRAVLSYLRFAFLPILPLKSSYSLHCYRCCRSSSTEKPDNKMIPILSIFNKFTGLVLLILALFYYASLKEQAIEAEYRLLAIPQKFDHYFIDISRFNDEAVHQPRYKVAKVVSRDQDSVDIVLGNYEYRKKNQVVKAIRLDNMMIDDYFSDNSVNIPISKLHHLRAREAIYAAHRPENLTLFGGLVMRPQRPKAFLPKLPNAINRQGVELYHQGFHREAFELFRQEAERGDGWAMLNLAQMYRDGEGTGKDLELAIDWFEKAALQAIPKAKDELLALCQTSDSCKQMNGV